MAGSSTSSPRSDATIWEAISMPKRAVGVKLLIHRASIPSEEISVEFSIGSPECSRAS